MALIGATPLFHRHVRPALSSPPLRALPGTPSPVDNGGYRVSLDEVAAAAAAAIVRRAAHPPTTTTPTSDASTVPLSVRLAAAAGRGPERRERVLLRPWLENLIESGTVPGLEWIDEAKTTFKVPWKHRSKKNWSLLHSCVFLVS